MTKQRNRKRVSRRPIRASGEHNAIAAVQVSEILMLLLIEKGLLTADEVVQAVEDLAEHHRVAWEEAETGRGRALHKRIHAPVERFLMNRSFYGAAPVKRKKARPKS